MLLKTLLRLFNYPKTSSEVTQVIYPVSLFDFKIGRTLEIVKVLNALIYLSRKRFISLKVSVKHYPLVHDR